MRGKKRIGIRPSLSCIVKVLENPPLVHRYENEKKSVGLFMGRSRIERNFNRLPGRTFRKTAGCYRKGPVFISLCQLLTVFFSRVSLVMTIVSIPPVCMYIMYIYFYFYSVDLHICKCCIFLLMLLYFYYVLYLYELLRQSNFPGSIK